jgi:transposase
MREHLRPLKTAALIKTCTRLHYPATRSLDEPASAIVVVLRRLARRYEFLTAEIRATDAELRPLITTAAPQMLTQLGVGLEVTGQLLTTVGDNPARIRPEAAFAHLCGVAPIPASTGKTHRHRLNRGGDRAANNAL